MTLRHRKMMSEQFNPTHWRTGELPFDCNELWRVVQAAFSHLWFLYAPFSGNPKPLSLAKKTWKRFMPSCSHPRGAGVREGRGAACWFTGNLNTHGMFFQNPNRVQNINIPRNLLFPHIICLLKKKRLKKNFNVWLQWQRVGANSSLDGFLSHSLSENS